MGTGLSGHLIGETRTPQEIRDAVYLFTGDVGAKQSVLAAVYLPQPCQLGGTAKPLKTVCSR